jgi:hypothetical protein
MTSGKVGRPLVGSPIHIRLGVALLERIDRYASAHGESRAVTIRRLLARALELEETD